MPIAVATTPTNRPMNPSSRSMAATRYKIIIVFRILRFTEFTNFMKYLDRNRRAMTETAMLMAETRK